MSSGLADLRSLTTLGDTSASAVLRGIAAHMDANGKLDADAFRVVFLPFLTPAAASSEERVATVLTTLFDLFGGTADGSVDSVALMAGLSVLCGGSPTQRIGVGLALHAGVASTPSGLEPARTVTVGHLTTYLRSVFTVLLESHPTSQEVLGCTADQLAQATAATCFQAHGLSPDPAAGARLALDAAQAWLQSSDDAPVQGVTEGEGAQLGAQAGATEPASAPGLPHIDQREAAAVRYLATLAARLPLSGVADQLRDVVEAEGEGEGEGGVPVQRLFGALNALLGMRLERDPQALRGVTTFYRVLQGIEGRSVPASILVCGLAVLCGGSPLSKVQRGFWAMDEDRDGYLSHTEAVSFLTAVFRVMFSLEPGACSALVVSPDVLAAAVAEQCAAATRTAAGATSDSLISLQAFCTYFFEADDVDMRRDGRTADDSDPVPQALSVEYMSQALGLANATLEDVLGLVNATLPTDDTGSPPLCVHHALRVTRWVGCLKHLLTHAVYPCTVLCTGPCRGRSSMRLWQPS